MSVEELQSTTLANFVAQLNAIYGAGTYAFDPTTDPNTGGGPDGLIYRTNTVQVMSARALPTGQTVLLQSNGAYTTAHNPGGGTKFVTRAPMVYQLRPIGYGSTNDFYMYVSHARSTSDDSVGDGRYAEAQEVRSDAKYNLPAGAHILYGGDWNLFGGSYENAYKCLTGQTTSDNINWSDTSAIWANTNQTQGCDPTSKATPPTTTTWTNAAVDNANYLYGDATEGSFAMSSRIDIQLPNALMFGVYNNQGGVQIAPDTSDPFDSSNFPSAQYPYACEVFGNNGTTPRGSTPTSSSNHSLDDLTNTVPSASTVKADLLLTGSGSSFTGSDHYPIVGDYIIVAGTPPSITVGPASRTNTTGTTATFTVSATGTSPLSYQWRKNTTNLTNAGNVSGVTTTNLTLTNLALGDAGNYTVVISNGSGAITSSIAVLTVMCPGITVEPASLPDGTAGMAYDQTNTASSGSGPYSFVVTGGSLPTGLNLNFNSGVISGTPTSFGTNTFTVTATDVNGCTGSSSYTMVIACPTITVAPASLADGTVNASYLATNTASGGVGSTTFAVTSGSLPAGLNLNTSSGVISGIPTSAGTNTFTVTATDANGCMGSSNYTLLIANPMTVGPISLTAEGFGTNGNFQFQLSSSTNTGFGIQASTNLSDWTNIGSGVTDTNGTLLFQDTNAADFPGRFYRAYWLP
jgi:hypothetical protein